MRPGRILAVVLLLAPVAGAHDFWIEPSTFRPAAGVPTTLRLKVGERWRGDPVPRNDEKIEKFVVVGPDGKESPVGGRDGSDPAGAWKPAAAGLHVVGYRTKRTKIELEAAKFEAYLEEEGLDEALRARKEKGTSGAPGKEVYSRCAKTLLLVGEAPAPRTGFDRAVGLRLELIPEADPTALAVGATWTVRLAFDDAPAKGVLVKALPKDAPEKAQSARTDEKGRATFTLDRAGVWLVKAVHMVPAPAATGADWESLWASLTFDVPAAP